MPVPGGGEAAQGTDRELAVRYCQGMDRNGSVVHRTPGAADPRTYGPTYERLPDAVVDLISPDDGTKKMLAHDLNILDVSWYLYRILPPLANKNILIEGFTFIQM